MKTKLNKKLITNKCGKGNGCAADDDGLPASRTEIKIQAKKNA